MNNNEDKLKQLLDELKSTYALYTDIVRYYEEQRRNCDSEFYLKSYQNCINKYNAMRELIRCILDKYDN